MALTRRITPARFAIVGVATLLLATGAALPASAISQVDTVQVGVNPASIAIRPDGAFAFVANYGGNTVSVINTSTQATSSMTVGNTPSNLAMRPGTNELWVTNYASGTVSIIDVTTFSVLTTVTVSPSAQDIAFTPDGAVAFVSIYNDDVVLEVTASTRTIVDTYAVGQGPSGMVVHPARNRVIVANQDDDTLSFINLSTDAVTSISTGNGPVSLYLDTARNRAYVSNFVDGTVRAVDLTTDTQVASIAVGTQPNGMSGSFDGNLLFVARNAQVRVIDLTTNTISSSWSVGGLSWDVEMAPNGRTVYSAGFVADQVSVAALDVERFAGADRYATSIQLSQEAYPSGSSSVFVASGVSFPDALSISSAVGVYGGPLLLTAPNQMRADVLAEVSRLAPTTIFVAGGAGSVSNAVVSQLASTGATVMRLEGSDRYATSRAVIREFFDNPSGFSDLYVVNGRDFPDALSAGAAASVGGMPMLLVNGGLGSVPAETIDLITTTLQTDRVILVGGTGVMSAGIQNQLDALPGVSVLRAAGADRYATSLAVTRIGFDGRTASAAYWATGTGFPDALSGITVAAAGNAPLVLVRPTCVPAGALSDGWRLGADRIVLIGGVGVLSPAVANLSRC